MIVLDTNVVSGPMKRGANPMVQNWLDRQASETLYLTRTRLSELLLGIEILPPSKRKRGLDDASGELLVALFGGRILPFDYRRLLPTHPWWAVRALKVVPSALPMLKSRPSHWCMDSRWRRATLRLSTPLACQPSIPGTRDGCGYG